MSKTLDDRKAERVAEAARSITTWAYGGRDYYALRRILGVFYDESFEAGEEKAKKTVEDWLDRSSLRTERF